MTGKESMKSSQNYQSHFHCAIKRRQNKIPQDHQVYQDSEKQCLQEKLMMLGQKVLPFDPQWNLPNHSKIRNKRVGMVKYKINLFKAFHSITNSLKIFQILLCLQECFRIITSTFIYSFCQTPRLEKINIYLSTFFITVKIMP